MCMNPCMILPARIYYYPIYTPFLRSHYTITPSYCSPAVNLTETTTTTLTSVIQDSLNTLCGDGTNMPVVTGSVGGVMGLIILTQIVVIVVLLLRQSVKGKANMRYDN